MKKVIISGVTGQDGSYLVENYLSDGWEVHGLVRRSSSLMRPRIDHLEHDEPEKKTNLKLHYSDLHDFASLIRIIDLVEPDHFVNLAAQSHVGISFELPLETAEATGVGAANIFEAVRLVNPQIRVYQASTSEMFGGEKGSGALNEESPFLPRSPYAAAKLYAHNMAIIYRESYGMHISNGILFNHESPRRGENFVSRKITKAVARIHQGKQSQLFLGNLEATRDWGHARDYMEAIRMILKDDTPDDYVVATGEAYSVLDFVKKSFEYLNLDYEKYLFVDPKLFRPNEVHDLLGDPTKITKKLGWTNETRFSHLG